VKRWTRALKAWLHSQHSHESNASVACDCSLIQTMTTTFFAISDKNSDASCYCIQSKDELFIRSYVYGFAVREMVLMYTLPSTALVVNFRCCMCSVCNEIRVATVIFGPHTWWWRTCIVMCSFKKCLTIILSVVIPFYDACMPQIFFKWSADVNLETASSYLQNIAILYGL